VSAGFRWAAWGLTLYTLVVVYVGAYVRHTNAQMACIDWPLCNGSLFPGFAGPVGIVFGHRVTALVLTIGIGWLALWTRRLSSEQADLHRASVLAFGLVVAQGLSGAVVVFTRMELFAALSHAALIGLLFAVLAYLCLRATPGVWAVKVPGRRGAARPALAD
jgi:cytochrome c oxidase assembly protein subunit 15